MALTRLSLCVLLPQWSPVEADLSKLPRGLAEPDRRVENVALPSITRTLCSCSCRHPVPDCFSCLRFTEWFPQSTGCFLCVGKKRGKKMLLRFNVMIMSIFVSLLLPSILLPTGNQQEFWEAAQSDRKHTHTHAQDVLCVLTHYYRAVLCQFTLASGGPEARHFFHNSSAK